MFVVNLFGAPGSGKSTGAAYIFAKLKMLGVNAELVTEFAKEKVWENSKETLKNQFYIFGEQYFKLTRLDGKVDVAITDAPLLLSVFYNKEDDENFNQVVLKKFLSFPSVNYFINRVKPYNPKGRLQTEEGSSNLVEPMRRMLQKYEIEYLDLPGDIYGYDLIVDQVEKGVIHGQ